MAQASPSSELSNVFIFILSASEGFGFGFPLIIPLFAQSAVTACLSYSVLTLLESPALDEFFVEEMMRAFVL